MHIYPECDSRWKGVRDNRFPTLEDHHPSFKVEGSFRENDLQVLFRFEAELEYLWSQVSPSNSPYYIPVLEKEINQCTRFLYRRISNSTDESIFVTFNEVRDI